MTRQRASRASNEARRASHASPLSHARGAIPAARTSHRGTAPPVVRSDRSTPRESNRCRWPTVAGVRSGCDTAVRRKAGTEQRERENPKERRENAAGMG